MNYNTKSRNEKIQKMRESGMTFEDIGKVFNISRQRVHQIITLQRLRENK